MSVRRTYLLSAAALLLAPFATVHAAEQDTVQLIIPWEAEGQVFQIDTQTMQFLGAMEGVMYVESSRGQMHEAFVKCPVTQELNIDTGKTEAHGHCEITASDVDVVFADFSCKGEVGDCDGKFTLTDGEGKFAGISGTGQLRVRSPIRSLIANMASGAVIRVGAGLATIKDLKYRIP